MKTAHILINTFLTFLIILSAVTFVAAYSLTTKKLSATAEQSGVNSAVAQVASKELTNQVAANLGVAPEQVPPQYADLVSEKYVTAKSNELFDQVQAYMDGKGNGVVLDLSDIAATTQAAGLNINAAEIDPIVIAPESNEQGGSSFFNPNVTRWVTYILTVVLAVASVVLSVLRKSFLGLGIALLVSSAVLGLITLAGSLIEGFAVKRISFSGELAGLTEPVQNFVRNVLSDMNSLYLYQFLILLALGIIFFVVHKLVHPKKPVATLAQQNVSDDTQPASTDK